MIIAITNTQRGTGKTTTSINLAGAFSDLGYTTLIVDLDPRASASLALGSTRTTLRPSLFDVLVHHTPFSQALRPAPKEGPDLLPADERLRTIDSLFALHPTRNSLLRAVLYEIEEDYDFIFCDCPSTFSLLSLNALTAAQGFLIPVTPDFQALRDLDSTLGLVQGLQEEGIVDLRLLGLLMNNPSQATFFPWRKRDTEEGKTLKHLRQRYGRDVCATQITKDKKLAEAPGYGTTIFGRQPQGLAAKQYKALALELLEHRGLSDLETRARQQLLLRQRRTPLLPSPGRKAVTGQPPASYRSPHSSLSSP